MKMKRIFIIFLVISILIIPFYNKVYAGSIMGEMKKDVDDFVNDSEAKTTLPIRITPERLKAASQIISHILFVIAVAVAIITTVALGINFMVQSVEEKAKIQESLIPLVIGMIVSFGAYGIWKIIVAVFVKL